MAWAYVNDDQLKQTCYSFDIIEEPQQIYLSIEEDKLNSVISLLEAVDPLVEFVPNIHKKVALAKQKCLVPSDDLSCDESASIYLCSMRWKPYNECLYCLLNATLCDDNKQELIPWSRYLKLLFTALDQLPSNQITFYLEMEDEFIKNYSFGKFFIFYEFTFCSLSTAFSKLTRLLDSTKKRTFFAFECYNAKFIEQHSCNNLKNEILLAPTQFQFIDYLDRKEDLDIIRLREINKPSPLIKFNIHPHQSHSAISNKELNQETTMTTTEITTSASKAYRNPKLERLISLHLPHSLMNLTYQKLTVADMDIVAEQAIIGKQCTKLVLDNNYITTECLSILLSALHNNKILNELNLNEAGISDESVKILMKTVARKNCSIRTVGLRNNNITEKSIPYIIKKLNKRTTSINLYLYPNPISRKGKKQLNKEFSTNANILII